MIGVDDKLLLDIFCGILKDTGDRDVLNIRKKEVQTKLNGADDIFQNEYYVLYKMVTSNLQIHPHKAFLDLHLQVQRSVYTKSRNIDMSKYTLSGEDAYDEFSHSCKVIYDECIKHDVSNEDFAMSLEMYKMKYIQLKGITMLEESAVILTEGVSKRGKSLSGFSDMSNNIKKELLKLENLTEQKDRKGLITYGVNDVEATEEDDSLKLITTFGVEELDKHIQIYEGDMVSILAPAKGGKSRFTCSVLHNAVVKHQQNVVVWSIENGYKGWEYLIRARHFDHVYNTASSDGFTQRVINDNMIRKGKLDPEMKALEQASWTDLKTNRDYGKVTNIDEDFDFDTFMDVLDNAVTTTGAKLVCIDYLQLIEGVANGMTKNERIGYVYKKVLQYLKKKKIAGVFPAQLKQSVVGELDNVTDEDLMNIELRDSAGESYEVIKTPDINLALYASVEDIRGGKMKLLSMPSRNSAPFMPINMYVDLGCCTFNSMGEGDN